MEQKDRKPHQFIAIGLARASRHCPARPRRYEDELVFRPGRGAGRKIQSESQLGQEVKLEARKEWCDGVRVVEPVKDRIQRVVDRGVRLAFGEQSA